MIDKNLYAKNSIWKSIETIFISCINITVSIYLARLLSPKDYGIFALTTIFTTFSQLLVQGGFNIGILSKKEITDLEYTTALVFNLIVALFCYIIFFLLAPIIARFYNEPILINVIRIQMLILFFIAISTIPYSILIKNFNFKILFFINFLSNIISGIIALVLAFNNFNIYALVMYTLLNSAINTILLYIFVKFKLDFSFKLKEFKNFLLFCINALSAGVVDFLGNNISNMAYGRIYSMDLLGYYNKGVQIPTTFGLHTMVSITSVFLPTLSQIHEDKNYMLIVVRKIVKMSAYIVFPIITGIIIVRENFVLLLLTEKWIPILPIMFWCSIGYYFQIFRYINNYIFYALGKSNVVLKVEIFRFFLLMFALCFFAIFLRVSIFFMSFLAMLVSFIIFITTQTLVSKFIGYNFKILFNDIFLIIIINIIMGIAVYFIGFINLKFVLILQILAGVLIYILLSIILRINSFFEIINIIKNIVVKKKI